MVVGMQGLAAAVEEGGEMLRGCSRREIQDHLLKWEAQRVVALA